MAIFEHFIECTFEKESDMHRITSDTLPTPCWWLPFFLSSRV